MDTVELWMARRTKRLWTDEEKRSICFQTTAPEVSVAQVARRYAVNANLIFTWLRDPRYAPNAEDGVIEEPLFLPVEIIDDAGEQAREQAPPDIEEPCCRLEVDLAGGHRLRVIGAYDPEALAGLIRRLSS